MKTEKRIGYVDLLNKEFKRKITAKITTSDGAIQIETRSLNESRASLVEATQEVCVGCKGHIYEVILRRVE